MKLSICSSSILVVVLLSLANASVAQEASSLSSEKRLEISKTTLSPELDGVLDDPIWQSATLITDLHQYKPVDQGTPSQKSEFYVTYSEDYLYVGARLYDDNPAGINALQLIQGSSLDSDDSIAIVLDTFNNKRTGYQFEVNPNGIRREGLFDGPDSINHDWSGIWLVEARIDDKGWTAEIAIPFNSISFEPNTEEWGFSITRTIASNNENIAWSSFNRTVDPSTSGSIYGIRDLDQGLGLDIIPSLSLSSSENSVTGVTDTNIEPAIDIFYKFTPNLTGALTLNTDFSATEVDNRQVNLTRFSLFFPEKRDFFLQDVDIFSFGGLTGGNPFSGGGNGIPFYSRRIGLNSSGTQVDINAGVKLTGRVGNLNLGALAVQQGEFQALDSQTVFVGRVAANVLNESTIGAMMTQGDPNSNIDNSLIGVDFHYQKTRFTNRLGLFSDFWYQQTDTDGLNGDQKAYGISAKLDSSSTGVTGELGYSYFGEDYLPALGFANRTGVETFLVGGAGRYYFDDHPIVRRLFSFMRFEQTKKLNTGFLQSETIFARPLNIDTHRGDRLGFGFTKNTESLEAPFVIRPGIVIPAGEYSFTSYLVSLDTSLQRAFAPSISFAKGDYYEGTRSQASIGAQWRPNEHLFINFNYDYQDVKMPQGDFVSRLVSAKVNYAFTAKWSWINLLQYDNFSNSMGLNSRLRWNPQAGENLYFVVNYNFDSKGTLSHLSSRSSEVVLKYTKNFRF